MQRISSYEKFTHNGETLFLSRGLWYRFGNQVGGRFGMRVVSAEEGRVFDDALIEMQKTSTSGNDRFPPSSTWIVVCVDRTRESANLVFWRPDRKGYTSDLVQAGHYLEHEAREVCDSGHHVRYRLSYLLRSPSSRTKVDRDSSSFFDDAKKADRILRARIAQLEGSNDAETDTKSEDEPST